MQEPTKKRRTDDGMVTIKLRVHPENAAKIKAYVRNIETGGEHNYTIAEVFPEYTGKEPQTAIRAYRLREEITQRELSARTGIPQRHISEMENGKRVIGKEMAKRLGKALKADYKMLL